MLGRVADDDIEFHLEYLLWLFRVDEAVGVAFQLFATLVIFLTGTAEYTMGVFPSVRNALKKYIAGFVLKAAAYRIFPIGGLGAIDGTAG